MGQCEVCTKDAEYTILDTDDLFKELFDSEIEKDISAMRKSHEDQVKNYKFITLNDQTAYKGKIVDGKKQGYGQLYSRTVTYYGNYQDDLPHGTGALITQYSSCIGKFEKGKMNGQGKQSTKLFRFNGLYVEGQRKEGVLQSDQYTYNGQILNDQYHGKGKLVIKDGTTYEGQFLANKFEGQGSLTYSNGNSYKGKFKEGKYHGYGEFHWAGGNSYRGQYLQGKRHGFGVLNIDGTEFAGHWNHGLRQGQGIFTDRTNQFGFGEWKNNLLVDHHDSV